MYPKSLPKTLLLLSLFLVLQALFAFPCQAKNTDNKEKLLIDYLGKDYSVVKEDFGEGDHQATIVWPYSIIYQEKGLEFPIQEGFAPSTFSSVICHQSHYPIIDDLYGDSSLGEYLDYFTKNGFTPEPQVLMYSLEENEIGYIDQNLHLLFRLKVGNENEPPKRIRVTKVDALAYSNEWKVFYVQQVLTWLGYDPGPIDSQFGAKTQAAISAFQKDHWMEVNGTLNNDFVHALNLLWEKKCRFGEQEPWYSAYETQLHLWWTSEVPKTSSFHLIYVDEDKIPELVLSGNCNAQGSWLLTWHDGKIDAVRLAALVPTYHHKKNILADHYTHMSSYMDRIYTIQDGKWVLTESGYYREGYNQSWSANQPDAKRSSVFYTWNDEEVSESTYAQHLRKYFPELTGKKPSFTYDFQGLLSALWNGKPAEKDKGIETQSPLMEMGEEEGQGEAVQDETVQDETVQDEAIQDEAMQSQNTSADFLSATTTDLSKALGMKIDDISSLLGSTVLEYKNPNFYRYTTEEIEGVLHGFKLWTTEAGYVKVASLSSLSEQYNILGVHPGMTVGETLSILYEKGYTFQEAASTNGVLNVYAKYTNGTAQISFVTNQKAAHNTVTREDQISNEALIQSISIFQDLETDEVIDACDISIILDKTPLEAAQILGFEYRQTIPSPYDTGTTIKAWKPSEESETSLYCFGTEENTSGAIGFQTKESGYTLYGLEVDKSIGNVSPILTQKGYTLQNHVAGTGKYNYVNENKSFISITCESGIIVKEWRYGDRTLMVDP